MQTVLLTVLLIEFVSVIFLAITRLFKMPKSNLSFSFMATITCAILFAIHMTVGDWVWSGYWGGLLWAWNAIYYGIGFLKDLEIQEQTTKKFKQETQEALDEFNSLLN